MPDEPKPESAQLAAPEPSEARQDTPEDEKDIGDFIARHVLDKDAVFFEG